MREERDSEREWREILRESERKGQKSSKEKHPWPDCINCANSETLSLFTLNLFP